MKKLIVGLLMTAMICSLAACGGKNQSSAGTDTSAVGETAENADSSASSEDVVAYQAGTWGPVASVAMITRDGRSWNEFE